MNRRIVLTISTATALGLATPWCSAASQAQATQAQERSIVGVWRTVVTPINCQTGQPLPVQIKGLFTFHDGGTMSEFGVAPGSTPARRSPGHGLWQRDQGWQDYRFTFIHNLYDAAGVFTGYQKVVADLELDPDGNSFQTQSDITVLDSNYNVVGTPGCARATGNRFE